ncbi:NADP-dependent oxidoreductase [Myroides odoratimimus]|uniref:NADP-dependent oxidoreductase n=1 Tax=Myroides odoratimimus TaxID=76832 RepID=UPI002578EDF4|nr:NADP-dependent oxidoreductase [Myroides odoratimimus]MDM1396589.1 NADP-dependent oxidoreductase [Myroides odoratimimus]
MKAIVLSEFGGVENLQMTEVEMPLINNEEVLVRVKALSINPVDALTRAGTVGMSKVVGQFSPIILGWDFSGVIESIGEDVQEFKVGDAVFGMVNFPGHGMAYAEYIAVSANQIALKPNNITHEQAAASTLAALTAWQTFTSYGKLRPKDKVLVHAASGGVGHYAVQIAKHLGAYVIGTSSAKNKEFVMELGVDEHIDYRSENFEEVVSEIDFVLEAIGGDNFQKSVKVLKQFGTLVVLPSGYTKDDEAVFNEKQLHGSCFMSVYSSGRDMKMIAELLEKGVVKAHISRVFDFKDMDKAHLYIENGNTVGKVVVCIS